MRRGRKLLVALCAAIAVTCFVVAPLASADNGGGTTATCTSGMTNDPTAQGYCPPVTPCTEGTTAVTQSNGDVVCVPPLICAAGTTATTDSNGNVTCVPPTTCAAGTTATTMPGGGVSCQPGTQCAAGTTAVTQANGTVICVPPPACAAGQTPVVNANGTVSCVVYPTTPPTVTPQVVTPAAGVAGAHHTQQTPPVAPTVAVAGAKHTAPVSHTAPATHAAVAPVHVTQSGGTLPFTGLQLGLFVAVGIALVGVGFLLHRTGRERTDA